MSVRISDVKAKFYSESGGGHLANAIVQLEDLPSPTCWLRGLQYLVPEVGVTGASKRFDFVKSNTITAPPSQEEILFSFPSPYFYGTQNFFFPEDSYFEITDSELYITSAEAGLLNNYAIMVYYT